MKDSTDKGTGDMFGEKRGRGRPKTGTAKTGAEYLTVRLPKGLAKTLKDAQMKAVRNGTPSVELTTLRGQRPRPQAKPTA